MKKHDLILGIAWLGYCYLFYNQSAGINFLIFTLAMISFLIARNRSVLKSRSWNLTAVGSILSATCVMIYGSTSSVICTIVSLSLTTALSAKKESSLLFASLHAVYSYLSALLFLFIDLKERKRGYPDQLRPVSLKFTVTVVPVLIFLLFFFIYREANPVFKHFTEILNLDFITWSWVRFALVGFILLYGYFHARQITYLLTMESSASEELHKEQFFNEKYVEQRAAISNEFSSGIILFMLLNALLLIVNLLDINYIWISGTLPEGLSHADSVHQGIYALIASIVIAIIIILYYFRGSLNFHKGNNALKMLAYVWIIQNVILILTSAAKNTSYISEYSLTYKRIGVYIYLLLAFIGLITTFIKILQVKTNWFLLRKNGWAFYSVFICCCLFNWDLIVARYNIKYSENLDKDYLLSLSDTVIPELMQLTTPEPQSQKERAKHKNFVAQLNNKKDLFLLKQKYAYWQSWNMEDQNVLNAIQSQSQN